MVAAGILPSRDIRTSLCIGNRSHRRRQSSVGADYSAISREERISMSEDQSANSPLVPRRTIRSFVRREGRMTPSQERALEELWPRYGVEAGEGALDLAALFASTNPVYLEIGFGMGDSLLALARRYPERNYLGIEVHRPGVGRLLNLAAQHGVQNLRVMSADAVEVLTKNIPGDALDGIYLFFPDPWHKKRHHKRRIVQPAFTHLIARKLKHGGVFHMATDWEHYAHWSLEILNHTPGLKNLAPDDGFASNQGDRPPTKFERRGLKLGHGVWDLMFSRV